MKSYIFDLDGTLLDSMDVWEQIDVDFLAKRGIPVPPDYINAICSRSFQEAAQYTIDRFSLPEKVEDLILEWNEMAEYTYGHTVNLKPNALQYLTTLKAAGAKIGIATSLPETLYLPALQNNKITDFFDVICSADEVSHGKTKPDLFYYTAKKLSVAPSDCILFEDILPAVKSAKKTGMTVYGVYDKSSADQFAEIKQVADGVIYDFKDAPLP